MISHHDEHEMKKELSKMRTTIFCPILSPPPPSMAAVVCRGGGQMHRPTVPPPTALTNYRQRRSIHTIALGRACDQPAERAGRRTDGRARWASWAYKTLDKALYTSESPAGRDLRRWV